MKFQTIHEESCKDFSCGIWLGSSSYLCFLNSCKCILFSIVFDSVCQSLQNISFRAILSDGFTASSKSKLSEEEEFTLAVYTAKNKLNIVSVTCNQGNFNVNLESRADDPHGSARVSKVAWVDSNFKIVTVGQNNEIKLWSRYCKPLQTIVSSRQNLCNIVVVSNTCFVYSFKNSIAVLNCDKQQVERVEWKAHDKDINCLKSFENFIASTGFDKRCRLWDTKGNQLYQSPPFSERIMSIHPVNCGIYIYLESRIFLFSRQYDSIREIPCLTSNLMSDLAISSDFNNLGFYSFCFGNQAKICIYHISKANIKYLDWEISTAEPNLVQVTQTTLKDTKSVELIDCEEYIVRVIVKFHRVGVVLSSSQFKLYNLNDNRQLCVKNLGNLESLILLAKDNFYAVDSVFSYDGNKILKCSTSMARGCLNSCFLVSFENITGLSVTNLSTEEITKIETDIQIEKIIICEYFEILGALDVTGQVYLYMLNNFVEFQADLGNVLIDIAFSESASIMCCLGKEMIYIIPCLALQPGEDIIKNVDYELIPLNSINIRSIDYVSNCTIQCLQVGGNKAVFKFSPIIETLLTLLSSNISNPLNQALIICRTCRHKILWAIVGYFALIKKRFSEAIECFEELSNTVQSKFLTNMVSKSDNQIQADISLLNGDFKQAEMFLLGQNTPLIYEACMLNINAGNFERAKNLAGSDKNLLELVLIRQRTWQNRCTTPQELNRIEELELKLAPFKSKEVSQRSIEAKDEISKASSDLDF